MSCHSGAPVDSLNLQGDRKLDLPATPKVIEPKSPAIAFFISLLLPGAGQVYCGKVRRGIWTLVFFILPIAIVVAVHAAEPAAASDELMGVALFFSVVLYPFSFLDAYFTATEINQGMDYPTAPSPRVAAVLNFLTSGFGYVYVGEKRKGVVVFLLLRFASGAVAAVEDPALNLVLTLGLLGIAGALAADAYRIATAHLKKFKDEPVVDTGLPHQRESLNPAIPVGLALLIGLGFIGLTVIGTFIPDYSTIDHAADQITFENDARQFNNHTYGISVEIPADWEFGESNPRYLIQASAYDWGCLSWVILDSAFPLYSLEDTAADLVDQVLAEHENFTYLETNSGTLGAMSALVVTFRADVFGDVVYQNYYLAKSGATNYALVESVRSDLRALCGADLESIRNSFAVSR